VAPMLGRVGGITPREPKHALRPPLSGRISAAPDPGLKPWAVLYSRFAAKADASIRDKKAFLGPVRKIDSTSSCGQEGLYPAKYRIAAQLG